MADMDDLYYGLQAGLHAARALETWVRGVDARDSVRSDIDCLEQGLKAYEALRCAIRDGRKHLEYNEEEADRTRVHAVNLTTPDAGYQLCDECHGEGTQMVARMYPSGHTECTETCDACDGEGQVEIEDAAMSTPNKGESK
jgi:hypothetical protein